MNTDVHERCCAYLTRQACAGWMMVDHALGLVTGMIVIAIEYYSKKEIRNAVRFSTETPWARGGVDREDRSSPANRSPLPTLIDATRRQRKSGRSSSRRRGVSHRSLTTNRALARELELVALQHLSRRCGSVGVGASTSKCGQVSSWDLGLIPTAPSATARQSYRHARADTQAVGPTWHTSLFSRVHVATTAAFHTLLLRLPPALAATPCTPSLNSPLH